MRFLLDQGQHPDSEGREREGDHGPEQVKDGERAAGERQGYSEGAAALEDHVEHEREAPI